MPVSNTVIRGNKKLRPIKNNIVVYDMHFGERTTTSGLILIDDDAAQRGIRPRWAKVWCVGPEQTDVEPGMWVLIAHGRWTRTINFEIDDEFKDIRMVDPKDVFGYQWDEPLDEYVADSQTGKF